MFADHNSDSQTLALDSEGCLAIAFDASYTASTNLGTAPRNGTGRVGIGTDLGEPDRV
jgi:hypothetical protein